MGNTWPVLALTLCISTLARAADNGLDTSQLAPGIAALAALQDPPTSPTSAAPAPAAPTASAAQPASSKAFGTRDTFRLNIQGAYGTQIDDNNSVGSAGIGLSYFMIDNLSIDVELNGLYFNQDGPDAAAVNLNLLLRWHVIPRDTWSLYLDGGCGFLVADDRVPANGTPFNLTPQLGAGVTYDIGNNVRLFGGARWLHVSNANLSENNPGRDHLLLYLGISFPF